MGRTKKNPANGSGSKRFIVTLEKKAASTPLGLSVDYTDLTTIGIEKIKPGLVKQWNSRHPLLAVKAGDKILGANGVKGDPDDMFEEIGTCDIINLVIERKGNVVAAARA